MPSAFERGATGATAKLTTDPPPDWVELSPCVAASAAPDGAQPVAGLRLPPRRGDDVAASRRALGEVARRLGHSVETLVSTYVGALVGDEPLANSKRLRYR